MAWMDDRAWCHPKLVNLSDRAWRVYFSGIAYSAGMGTKGVLTMAQQRLLGANVRAREELLAAELWNLHSDESVGIHDWDLHNGKRDERRKKDRERKKSARASAGTSAGHSNGASAGTAHVEGSEGSEGSEVSTKPPRTTTDVGGST